MEHKRSLRRSILLGLAIFAGMLVYAYGFQVTQVSIDKLEEPRRQESFVRIMRALARPDIFEYSQEEFVVETSIYMPCNDNMESIEPDISKPYMVVDPPCNDPGSEIQIEGFNFAPNTQGPINFVPLSGVSLQLGQVETDDVGHFIETVNLPKRQPVEEAQLIRAITRRNVGRPHLSNNGKSTWEKIVETVFLALLASSLGTILALPVSFLAARNIMKDVTSPLASISLSIIAWPTGIFIGIMVGRWIGDLSKVISLNITANLAALVISPVLAFGLIRWALPAEEIRIPRLGTKILRIIALLLTSLLIITTLFLLALLAAEVGYAISKPLGPFGFLGLFFANLGDIVNAILIIIVAFIAGGVLGNWGGRFGQRLTERITGTALNIINYVFAAIAGAFLFLLIGAGLNWLYQIYNPLFTLYIPVGLGGLIGIIIAVRTENKEAVPIGLSIYYVLRTILNALRSIDAFIMAIIFVVLVSTGPFAGVLALSLHTVAALAKLYSEQVESILPGPLEAIKATGATRLQTIIYAVIPQIVPPYISFTMYRWDINVRMSTIIGFAGGGGIGLLLQQNINLLNYRAAAAQMLAITVVVALMDYFSSVLREKVV